MKLWNRLSTPMRWFVMAFVVLLVSCWLTLEVDLDGREVTDVLEYWAHQLGHGINSVWVGISLLMLLGAGIMASRSKDGRWKTHRTLWWVPDVILCDFIFVDALGKNTLPFPRPDSTLEHFRAGFPSGHATFAFAIAWLVSERFPKLAPLWFGMATAIGWSRVEVHAHYPYQVFAGAIIGALIGYGVARYDNGVLLPHLFSRKKTPQNSSEVPPAPLEKNVPHQTTKRVLE